MRTILLVFLALTGTLKGQSWASLNLPPNQKSIGDLYVKTRPALTFFGWDNNRSDGVNDNFSNATNGVKQLLEKIFVAYDSPEKVVFKVVITQAKVPIHRNYSNILGQSWGTAMSDKAKAAENAVTGSNGSHT
jgi:hypothetical protein